MAEKSFGPDDVEILQRRRSHDGFLKVDSLTLRHRLFAGGWSGEVPRELIVRQRAVAVLLFDPLRNEVVMVRQFRVGMLQEQCDPWLLELVAGMVDHGEPHDEVARRESLEEANLSPVDLVQIGDYYNSPGTSNERVILFCGRVDASKAGGVYGLSHEHEDIEVVVLSLEQALAKIESGAINNAMSIIALQWLQLNRQKLLQEWGVK